MPAAATATPSEWVIDLEHVSKTYAGGVQALRGIEMKVRRGEIFGLLGPNGAGKSTLVKILLTIIRPTQARGTLLGHPVGHKPTLARIGYLPEHHRFPGYLTGAQILDFYGAMSGVPRADRRRRAAELLDLVGMTAWATRRVRGYSKGMRQRIGIAQALVSNPDLVVLDEPTDGVDPVGRREIRTMLATLRERGNTIFLNSHLLSELEMVCDRVAILVKGKVFSQGTIADLTAHRQCFEIEIADADPVAAFASAVGVPVPAAMPPGVESMPLGTLPSGVAATLTRTGLRLETIDARDIQPVIDALRTRGCTIRSVRALRPSLEDLFMEAVIDPGTGAAMPPGAVEAGRQGGKR
jgi:ABC-2 type transport system ATP-binding protein